MFLHLVSISLYFYIQCISEMIVMDNENNRLSSLLLSAYLTSLLVIF